MLLKALTISELVHQDKSEENNFSELLNIYSFSQKKSYQIIGSLMRLEKVSSYLVLVMGDRTSN